MTPKKPSALAVVLHSLTHGPGATPLPPRVKSLTVELAARNTHMGARYFIKQNLPRLAYANPSLAIKVDRRSEMARFEPKLVVDFHDGPSQTLVMTRKDNTAIVNELLQLTNHPEATSMRPSTAPEAAENSAAPASES